MACAGRDWPHVAAMRFRRIIAALALAAIGSGAVAGKGPKYPASIGQSALYACADGRSIEVLYSGGDAVVLTVAGRTVQMLRAVAADGERYVGDGWQWWGRGARDGTLGPLAPGQDVGSAGVACHVR